MERIWPRLCPGTDSTLRRLRWYQRFTNGMYICLVSMDVANYPITGGAVKALGTRGNP